MVGIKELVAILGENICLNKCRLACFADMVVGLMICKTVNLKKLSLTKMSGIKAESFYRRMQRFFSEAELDFKALAVFLLSLFIPNEEKVYLTLDRTNWQYGEKNINILMLGVVYRGIAIPVIWTLLDKKGNSNTQEREEIINKFIDIFGVDRILGLLADREFIGRDWFEYLNKRGIKFVIRIKANTIVPNSRGDLLQVFRLFSDLKIGEYRTIPKSRKVWDTAVFISALRLSDGNLLLLATNVEKESAIELYKHRWEIETLFGCLKGRGFNFEDTRITNRDRVEKMVAVLAIAFVWAHKTGEWLCKNIKEIKIKKHGRRAISIFRYGLDEITRACLKLQSCDLLFIQWCKILKPGVSRTKC